MKKILAISTNTWEGIQELFINTDIQELTFTEEDYTITLQRQRSQTNPSTIISPDQNSIEIANNFQTNQTTELTTIHPNNSYDDESKYTKIVSPIMGTFYTSSSPNGLDFVEIGSMVSLGTTVCIVEAMKIFNEVKSQIAGKVVEILKSKGSSVSVDEVLFIIEH